jgi:hypothetical protein
MIRRTVNRSEYEENPYAAWNAFVDIIAMESADDLSEIQQHAHFAFTYYSEVENGGHLQYFENQSIQHGDAKAQAIKALAGLEAIGAVEHRAVLSQAIDRWMATSRRRIGSVEEYVETASQGEFDDLDKACWQCQPEITVWLERYLDSHFADFIELE